MNRSTSPSLNEIVEVGKAIKIVPQERISEGIGEQIVDDLDPQRADIGIPVPSDVIWDVIDEVIPEGGTCISELQKVQVAIILDRHMACRSDSAFCARSVVLTLQFRLITSILGFGACYWMSRERQREGESVRKSEKNRERQHFGRFIMGLLLSCFCIKLCALVVFSHVDEWILRVSQTWMGPWMVQQVEGTWEPYKYTWRAGLNLRTRTQKVNGHSEKEVEEAQDRGQTTALGDTASVVSGSAPDGSGVD